jgi:hypothetical protein
MLSLIICSINPNILSGFKKNVSETIGVDFEFLIWDNRNLNYGLCKVYNQMASKAKYPMLIFLHEDLKFRTINWGQYVVEVFEKNCSTGLLGIAGGKYKSKLYSGWYAGTDGLDFYHVMHQSGEKLWELKHPEVWETPEVDVVSIDGIFMACPVKIWNKNKFDEQTFEGFHFYDVDFSLRISQNHQVRVTNNIDIIHLNESGDYGDKWVLDAFIFHEKRKNFLPTSTESIDIKSIDLRVAEYWLDWLKNHNISWRNRWRWVKDQSLLSYRKLWYSIIKFMLYKPLRLRRIHYLMKKQKHVPRTKQPQYNNLNLHPRL